MANSNVQTVQEVNTKICGSLVGVTGGSMKRGGALERSERRELIGRIPAWRLRSQKVEDELQSKIALFRRDLGDPRAGE